MLFGGFFSEKGGISQIHQKYFPERMPPPLGGRPGDRSFYKDVKDGFAETE